MDNVSDLFRKEANTDVPIEIRKYACTVVSLLPFALHEEKPHLLPSTYKVPSAKGTPYKLSVLHVESAIYYLPDVFDDKRNIPVTTTPAEMARSLVQDYVSAHIATGEDAQPGMFWVEGRLSEEEVVRYHPTKVAECRRQQNNWFLNLCAMADADWQKNNNMLAISDIQRLAAEELGIKRDWVAFEVPNLTKCPYCAANIDPISVKCFNCKEVVNVEKYKAMQSELANG